MSNCGKKSCGCKKSPLVVIPDDVLEIAMDASVHGFMARKLFESKTVKELAEWKSIPVLLKDIKELSELTPKYEYHLISYCYLTAIFRHDITNFLSEIKNISNPTAEWFEAIKSYHVGTCILNELRYLGADEFFTEVAVGSSARDIIKRMSKDPSVVYLSQLLNQFPENARKILYRAETLIKREDVDEKYLHPDSPEICGCIFILIKNISNNPIESEIRNFVDDVSNSTRTSLSWASRIAHEINKMFNEA